MDKRYQVFVSSTFKDLEEERKHIIQTLMEMDCIPAGMELFPAVDEEQWDFIKKVIDDCDYYLLLIGGRYGSLSPEGIGYTEMEYDYAVSKGMKVIALVHGKPDNLAQIKCEKDPALQTKLESFRNKVCTGRLVKFWEDTNQISGIVALSLTKTIKTYPAIGWVRADLVLSEDATKEILELRNSIKELELTIENLKTKPTNIEKFAQGEDLFKTHLRIIATTKTSNSQNYKIEIEASWNKIFRYLSPLMVVESSQDNLEENITQILRVICDETIKQFMNQNEIITIQSFHDLYKNHFHLIIIQFKALQLIKLSQRKHPPSDKNIYWTLTPYGDQLMTELNAIKR